MFDLPTSKTEIAQNATQLLVSSGTAGLVSHQITERTSVDSDNNLVEIGSGAIGFYVGLKLKPYTDAGVERIASTLSRVKFRKNKNATTTVE